MEVVDGFKVGVLGMRRGEGRRRRFVVGVRLDEEASE